MFPEILIQLLKNIEIVKVKWDGGGRLFCVVKELKCPNNIIWEKSMADTQDHFFEI